MIVSPSLFFSLFKNAFQGWKKDNATVWCAALAYFTIFSLGPLLLIVISILGIIFTRTSLEKDIYEQVQGLVGTDGAKMLDTVIHHAKKPSTSIWGTIIGTITLILGATGVFGQLQQMLNKIWGVTQKPKTGIINLIRSRLLNLSMVGVITFLLLVSLIVSTAISIIGTFLTRILPLSPIILEIINFIFSFIIITILFAFVMKVLPDVEIKWRNVWIGAAFTSLLFTIGKDVVGIYIGHSGISSEYGAAASLVVLLLWVYYSSQILFFGVEFTKAYTLMRGDKIIPNQYSVINTDEYRTVDKEMGVTKGSETVTKVAKGFTEGLIGRIKQKTHH